MNAKIADLELGTPAGHSNNQEDVDETDSVSIFDDDNAKKGAESTLSSCLKRVFYGQVYIRTNLEICATLSNCLKMYRSNKRKQQDFADDEEEGDEAVEIHIEKEFVDDTTEKPQKKNNNKMKKTKKYVFIFSSIF